MGKKTARVGASEKITVYLIGFDGASLNTIDESRSRVSLPNFEILLRGGASYDLLSVYPYVTAPAWATIFSGVNPGEHGIFDMFKIRDGKIMPSNIRSSDVPFLWDYLTWANKRSLFVGIPFLHPAPRINGVFVTGRFSPRLSCYPEDIARKFDLSGFSYDDLSMEGKTDELIEKGQDQVAETILANFGKRIETMTRLLDQERWDVATLIEGLPDDLLHISYGDHGTIDKMYTMIDRLLGEIIDRMDEKRDSLLVFSDHGFTGVASVLFMNEWLRAHGYASNEARGFVYRAIAALGFDWDSLSRPGIVSIVYKYLLRHFPKLLEGAKRSVRAGMVVDQSEQLRRSKVACFGINEPTAWLKILEQGRGKITVERLVSELEELKAQGILKNIFRTSEIYHGRYALKAPGEILVEGNEGWCIDTLRWNNKRIQGKPLLTKKGVHKRAGILATLTYPGREAGGRGVVVVGFSTPNLPRVHDIVPTVLDLVGLPLPEGLDGRSLFGNRLQRESAKDSPAPSTQVLNVAQRL